MKTTAAHFKVFCDESDRWIRELGLFDWSVAYRHENLKDKYSAIQYQFSARKARISLSTTFDEPVTVEKLKDSALHEVLHLVLADLVAYAEAAASKLRIEEAEHAALYRILRVLIR